MWIIIIERKGKGKKRKGKEGKEGKKTPATTTFCCAWPCANYLMLSQMRNVDITTFSMLHVWTLKPRGLSKLPRVRASATVQVLLIKGHVRVHGHPFTHAGAALQEHDY